MKTYEKNMADQALIVKSLKVLESIDGGGIREIRQSIETVKQNTALRAKQQEEYWKDLSDDGVISAVEKQGLRREMENIRQSYSAVTQQAASFGYTNPILQDYVNTYNALRTYIYDTLKLFDDMSVDTPIEDREYFNTLFSNYFFLENFILLAITKGVLDTLQFRVLESLNEPGEEGETALYHGGLYQYVDGRWKSVSTGNYKGARDELPAAEEDSFFLCSESFVMTDVLIVNDEELYVNEEELGILHTYIKGYIYYVEDGIWNVEEDRTNWRYAAAFADVLNVTGELPQIFQDALDNMQAQLDEKESHYLGASNTIPLNMNKGDYFTYTGGNLAPWYKGKVYKWNGEEWEELNPNNTANRKYYMDALADILASEVAGTGYFSTIFANAFFANDATLQSLSTKTIYLREGGYIQSDETGYVSETQGLRIDYNGYLDANNNVHLGAGNNKKVAIGVPLTGNSDFNNYDVVIGGNTLIGGSVQLGGNIISRGFEIAGVEPGDESLKKIFVEQGSGKVKTYRWMMGGSGVFRIKGVALSCVRIYINTESRMIYRNDDESTGRDISIDFSITAGDVLCVQAGLSVGGVVGVYYGYFNGGLYTKYPCGILTFLGKEITESSWSPGR